MKSWNLTDAAVWHCADRCGFIGIGLSFIYGDNDNTCPRCGRTGRDLFFLVPKPGLMAVWEERNENEGVKERGADAAFQRLHGAWSPA